MPGYNWQWFPHLFLDFNIRFRFRFFPLDSDLVLVRNIAFPCLFYFGMKCDILCLLSPRLSLRCPCLSDCSHCLCNVLLAPFDTSCLLCLISQIFHLRLLSNQNCLHHPLVFENKKKKFVWWPMERFKVDDMHKNVHFKSRFNVDGVERY